jgi:hypothetical protein
VKKWLERVAPSDRREVYKFEQRLKRVDEWFNTTMQTVKENTVWWSGIAVKPKTISEKLAEFKAEIKAMKKRFGGATMPTLMRRDGSPLSEEERESFNDMSLMKSMRDIDVDEELRAIGNAPVDDL